MGTNPRNEPTASRSSHLISNSYNDFANEAKQVIQEKRVTGQNGFVSGVLGTKKRQSRPPDDPRIDERSHGAGLALRPGTKARHAMTARSPCLAVYSEIQRLMDQHVNRATPRPRVRVSWSDRSEFLRRLYSQVGSQKGQPCLRLSVFPCFRKWRGIG